MNDSLRERVMKRQSFTNKFREEEEVRFGLLQEAKGLADTILHGSGISPAEYIDWVEDMSHRLRVKAEEYRAFVEQFKMDNEP